MSQVCPSPAPASGVHPVPCRWPGTPRSPHRTRPAGSLRTGAGPASLCPGRHPNHYEVQGVAHTLEVVLLQLGEGRPEIRVRSSGVNPLLVWGGWVRRPRTDAERRAWTTTGFSAERADEKGATSDGRRRWGRRDGSGGRFFGVTPDPSSLVRRDIPLLHRENIYPLFQKLN